MAIIILILALFLSFTLHIYFLIIYIIKKDNKYLRNYVNTTITNILIAGGLIYVALSRPEQMQNINIRLLLWILSGALSLIALLIKIKIFMNIYKRSKDPEHFHYNFFGKKVLHPGVVKPYEFVAFFGLIPFFCITGAYFVARLINIILYNHL